MVRMVVANKGAKNNFIVDSIAFDGSKYGDEKAV
jgi:hypothetical protein